MAVRSKQALHVHGSVTMWTHKACASQRLWIVLQSCCVRKCSTELMIYSNNRLSAAPWQQTVGFSSPWLWQLSRVLVVQLIDLGNACYVQLLVALLVSAGLLNLTSMPLDNLQQHMFLLRPVRMLACSWMWLQQQHTQPHELIGVLLAPAGGCCRTCGHQFACSISHSRPQVFCG